jgi:hypothetical protein
MKRYQLSLWTFIAGIFLLYGIILVATGLYYWVSGTGTSPVEFHHPLVWWGSVIFVAGIGFLQLSRKQK